VYALIVVMTVTGVLLYLGWGGWVMQVHSYAAFITAATSDSAVLTCPGTGAPRRMATASEALLKKSIVKPGAGPTVLRRFHRLKRDCAAGMI
jgi:hypothetical protein